MPTDPVSIAVALADKLDTLVGFWAIDEKPTGSKDPYALRRAALGVIRILVENRLKIRLVSAMSTDLLWVLLHERSEGRSALEKFEEAIRPLGLTSSERLARLQSFVQELPRRVRVPHSSELLPDLLSFFHDRLKVYLRDKGARHDLIDAVLEAGGSARAISSLVGEMLGKPTEGVAVPQPSPSADVLRPQPSQPYDMERGHSAGVISPLEGEMPGRAEGGASRQTSTNDDLLSVVRRVEALGAFLDTDAGKNLLAGTRRAANILAAEEKRGTAIGATVGPALFTLAAEKTLYAAVNQAESDAAQAIEREDYSAAMLALSALRGPVDSFFEDVHVNDEDLAVRSNRLALLSRIRSATGKVADFSRIAG